MWSRHFFHIAGQLALTLAVIVLLVAPLASAQPVTLASVSDISDDIKQIFPTATRVQHQETQRVSAVYQLNELLGYVFQSDDFTHILGFSGQTINLLIGIDPQGTLIKLKVLNHHEPIFLHGLGEQPMIDFVDQFNGHSIRERFIVDARDTKRDDITPIDGVTKATVSALVINDTIISAALKMARGMLDGFAPLSDKTIDVDYFRPLSFTQLVAQGFITHWQLSAVDTARQFPQLAQTIAQLEGAVPFVDLFIAPISLPIVGKNILGSTQYRRLLENIGQRDSVFMLIDNGAFGVVADDFIAQTAPERFKISQGGIAQDSRDIDFYSFDEPDFKVDFPQYQRLLVVNIK